MKPSESIISILDRYGLHKPKGMPSQSLFDIENDNAVLEVLVLESCYSCQIQHGNERPQLGINLENQDFY